VLYKILIIILMVTIFFMIYRMGVLVRNQSETKNIESSFFNKSDFNKMELYSINGE
jgi:hypothetical protein